MFLRNLLPVMAFFALLVVSCVKDGGEPEFKFKNEEVQIDYGKSLYLNLSDAEGATYESSDESVAYITEDGIVFADLVGKTTIKAFSADEKRFAKCEVTVVPTVTMYQEPIMASRITKTSVKSYEKTFRSLVGEDATGLLYVGENSNVDYVMYLFNSTTGYLESCFVILPTTTSAKTLVNKFLEQRYIYEGYAEGYNIYSRGTVLVGVGQNDELGLFALYLINTTTSNTASAARLHNMVQAGGKAKQAMKE